MIKKCKSCCHYTLDWTVKFGCIGVGYRRYVGFGKYIDLSGCNRYKRRVLCH